MTIHEYLNYPMGKNSAVFMIGAAKSKMIERYLLDESGLKAVLYNTGKTLVFHMEIPSHSTKGLTYDVVIEFPYSKADLDHGNNLFEFPFRVYSNCPSFIYSYAYIFYQRGLLIDWLISRYDKKTLTTPPTKRNEFGIIFYEESIFYAVYYIYTHLGSSLMLLTKSAKNVSRSKIKELITSQSDIRENQKEFKEINKLAKEASLDRSDENGVTHTSPTVKTKTARGISKPKGTSKARGTTKPKKK